MQRLFSTFAGGRPGVGLLLQRLLTGALLLHHGILCLSDTTACAVIVPQMVAAGAGVLLLAGLWTPVAGTLAAIMEAWIVWSGAGDGASSAMLAVLGATLALIGPGAWSIDSRLFGRRHIETTEL